MNLQSLESHNCSKLHLPLCEACYTPIYNTVLFSKKCHMFGASYNPGDIMATQEDTCTHTICNPNLKDGQMEQRKYTEGCKIATTTSTTTTTTTTTKPRPKGCRYSRWYYSHGRVIRAWAGRYTRYYKRCYRYICDDGTIRRQVQSRATRRNHSCFTITSGW